MRVKRPVSGLNAIGSAMIAILLLTVGYLCSVVACCLRLRHLFLLLLSPCLAPLCCYDDLLLVLLLLLLLLLILVALCNSPSVCLNAGLGTGRRYCVQVGMVACHVDLVVLLTNIPKTVYVVFMLVRNVNNDAVVDHPFVGDTPTSRSSKFQ